MEKKNQFLFLQGWPHKSLSLSLFLPLWKRNSFFYKKTRIAMWELKGETPIVFETLLPTSYLISAEIFLIFQFDFFFVLDEILRFVIHFNLWVWSFFCLWWRDSVSFHVVYNCNFELFKSIRFKQNILPHFSLSKMYFKLLRNDFYTL